MIEALSPDQALRQLNPELVPCMTSAHPVAFCSTGSSLISAVAGQVSQLLLCHLQGIHLGLDKAVAGLSHIQPKAEILCRRGKEPEAL